MRRDTQFMHEGRPGMKITRLTLWQVPLTSHIAYNMSDGKICDTVTSTILRLDADNGLSGWGEVCPIPHYLPAYADGVPRHWASWHRSFLAPTRWVSRR